jgi:hypothetical protein
MERILYSETGKKWYEREEREERRGGADGGRKALRKIAQPQKSLISKLDELSTDASRRRAQDSGQSVLYCSVLYSTVLYDSTE